MLLLTFLAPAWSNPGWGFFGAPSQQCSACFVLVFNLNPSFRPELRRGILMGAPLGYALGLALYGGIGLWGWGTTGLLVGCAIATAFAAIGLHLCLRYVEVITR
jgi:hypothetical protein